MGFLNRPSNPEYSNSAVETYKNTERLKKIIASKEVLKQQDSVKNAVDKIAA
jgi:hypothetical protein